MWPFRRQKSRTERLREEVGTTLAAVGDRVDQAVESFRERAPGARAEVRQTGRRLGRRAEDWREQATERAEMFRREARQSRLPFGHLGERVAAGIGQRTGDGLITRMTRAPVSRVATLAAVTTGVGQTVGRLPETVGEKISETSSRAGEAVSEAGARGVQRIKWGFTGFWLWVLRMGVGLWWLESLRHKNVQGLTNQETFTLIEQSAQAEQHPFPEYQRFVREKVAPRASLFARVALLAELFAGLGLLTGIMKRRAALVGLLLNTNYALMGWDKPAERDQNLMMALAEMVILATDA